MRNEYKLKDSATIFILAILVPIIVSFALSFVLAFVSIVAKVETESLLSNMWVYSLILLLSQGSFLAVVLIYNKKKKINTLKATTLNNKVGILKYLIVAIMSIVSLYMFSPIINLFDTLIRSWGYSNSGELPFAINNIPSLIVSLISLALLPAVCEEMVFRGAIFNGLKNSVGVKKAVVLSALCFCIMHMSLQQTIYPLLLGVALALILYFTKSVRVTIFAHFCNNAMVVISNYVASFSTTTDVEPFVVNFGTTVSSIIYLIIGCLIIALGCWLLNLLNKKQAKTENKNEVQNISQPIEMLEVKTELISENQVTESEIPENNTLLKADYKIFWAYIAIAFVMWIIENVTYFMG